MLLRLSDKVVDVLKYFGMYQFALRIDADLVRTAPAILGCSEVAWFKMGLEDGF